MRILLIEPPFQRLKGIYQIFFPLGLGYIAGTLRREGHTVAIYKTDIPAQGERLKQEKNLTLLKEHRTYRSALADRSHFVWGEIKEYLKQTKPDIVGISVMSAKLGSAQKVSEIVKEWNKECVVVWGGVHSTDDPDRSLRCPDVDIVVRSEGEATIAELVKAMEEGRDLRSVEGISFKSDTGTVHTPERALIGDLDAIPFPYREGMMKREMLKPDDFGDIITSRGCPFNCSFCNTSSIWHKKVRRRSVDNIIREIEDTKLRFGTKTFRFTDDSFTLDRNFVTTFCRRLKEKKLDIGWFCDTRVDIIDEALLSTIKEAGCLGVNIGIESGSEKILRYIKKGITLKQIAAATELLQRSGIDWNAYFLVGFPPETEEDLKKTFALMKKIKATTVTLSIFTPYPRTAIFQELKEKGVITADFDYTRYSHQSPENMFVQEIDKDLFGRYVVRMAKLADAINHDIFRMIKKFFKRSSFYCKHPYLFLKKVLFFIKRKFE